MHIPPITIDEIPLPQKRAWYTPDLLPAAIYVASGNSVSNLSTPFDSPDILSTDDTNTLHLIKNICPWKVGWKYDNIVWNMVEKYVTKRQGSIDLHALIRVRDFTIVMGFPGSVQRQGLVSLENQHYMSPFSIWLLCLSPFHPLIYLLNLFCVCFLPV